MKPSILLLVFIVAAISSCTTAYKTGQTPDDVYYSPARPEEEYVRIDNNDEKKYQYDEDYYDDRYLRMKVRNRYRWSDLDDWYFYGKTYSYAYSYNSPWGYTWNPYTSWNYYYNPYCHSCCVNIPYNPYNSYAHTAPVYNKPRNFNLNTYNSPTKPATKVFNPISRNTNTYSDPRNNSRSRDNVDRGNILRDIFNSNSNNNNSSSSGNSGNNNNSGSSGKSNTSSGSGKSTSAPVRKF